MPCPGRSPWRGMTASMCCWGAACMCRTRPLSSARRWARPRTSRMKVSTAASVMSEAALYPKAWQFKPEHIPSYRLGVGFAIDNLPNADLHLVPLEDAPWQTMTVGEIRKHFGIVKEELRAYFRKAELLVPGTRASRRLDTSAHRRDQSLNPRDTQAE